MSDDEDSKSACSSPDVDMTTKSNDLELNPERRKTKFNLCYTKLPDEGELKGRYRYFCF